jgi:hypothetical protein
MPPTWSSTTRKSSPSTIFYTHAAIEPPAGMGPMPPDQMLPQLMLPPQFTNLTYQGSILQSSVSAENFSDKFSSYKFYTNYIPKITYTYVLSNYYRQKFWILRRFQPIYLR